MPLKMDMSRSMVLGTIFANSWKRSWFFKFPYHDDKNDAFERIRKFFGEEEATAIALVNRLNNEFSHLESFPDRGFKPVEIPEIAKVANFVLNKIYATDPDQYNALLKSIGEPARVQ